MHPNNSFLGSRLVIEAETENVNIKSRIWAMIHVHVFLYTSKDNYVTFHKKYFHLGVHVNCTL